MYALSNPPDINASKSWLTSERVKIASIRLETPLMQSEFGDRRLHFQHQDGWEHLLRNWWKGWFDFETIRDQRIPANTWAPNNETIYLPNNNEKAKEVVLEGISQFGCPFAWLLNLVSVS